MALTNTKFCFFVTWTTEDVHIQKISYDPSHWAKIESSLMVFFKGYICPVLLGIKSLTYCSSCDKVLLASNEMKDKEREELGKISCNRCHLSYHLKCSSGSDISLNDEHDEWICSSCLPAMFDDHLSEKDQTVGEV